MTLRNALGDLATENTIGLIRTAVVAVRDSLTTLTNRTNGAADAFLISGSKKKYRREFIDPTLAEWTQTTGTGGSIVVNAATGQVVINSGTTANSETSLVTKQSFTAPFRMNVGMRLNQKISNQFFNIEIVAENEDGSLDETVVAAWRLAGNDATVATTARYEVRNGESTRVQSGNVTVQNHVNSDAIFEIALESDEVWFTTKQVDASVGKNASYVRNSVSPDPNRRYRVRLKSGNGSTAPSSNTVATMYFVTAVDYTEQQVEVTGGNGASSPGQSLPVNILQSVALSANATIVNSPGVTTVPNSSAVATSTAKVRTVAGANAANVKTSTARLHGYEFWNNTTAWRYVRIINKSSTPASGDAATTVLRIVGVPPGGVAQANFAYPIAFGAGMGWVVGVTPADDDFSTTIGATDIVGSIDFF